MNPADYTFIGFLVACVFSMAGFIIFLVKKIIKLTEDTTSAFRDLKFAVQKNSDAIDNNTQAIRELKTTIHQHN